MRKLIIYGVGDFAKLVKHMAEADGHYKVIGFCADRQYINSNYFLDLEVSPVDKLSEIYSKDETYIIVAAGYKSMLAREYMFETAKKTGFTMASVISKHACIDLSVNIGKNAIVFPGVQIEPFSVIGDNCIIWSSAVICHDSVVGDHCFIAAQSLLGGRAKIGKRSFMGFNSIILQDVSVGDDCLIGAKSLVTKDVPVASKCIGTPAHIVSTYDQKGVTV
ncbi:acetyltransferase [Rheinheimera sp. EpRS3]|uniref:acetyltransferase n=1 Tax=Rheinheimera sp. EpRS3 TaxID=1712383 RepID=UPI000746E47B|nr:acetyltransferase [Rheinheimera sp. EpRS3]KUM52481.1 hypothetical protein AR688_09265 [Rheinheimera sp. EpRS3]